MDRLFEFTANHPLLVLAFVVTLGFLIRSLLQERIGGYRSLGPQEAIGLINREDAVLLDTRENNEYKEGHIQGSIHIPLTALKKRLVELHKYRARPILVTCRSGSRSSMACATLRKDGFEQVYNLRGGVMAWQQANLPLQKK